ncbi:hypothetical protein MKS88_003128 [Plasmodium brasilianum]|uniref:Uncharacterized protein n=2 Tax=Plasmodium (Plasmodium) TaxID=418103 RepID=A0A1A8W2E6_PLAMA|nr:conserved Plasmodium protein, unknown function [Plasmodium malariae]KAI4837713.1 hypothetical protein MKS88_003128 [Plasmodium brasilianum]SBS86124.1 conserved Plasmodium protein, unknown function [Plasmodium malariae]SCN44653.1 conserved Plasmodium protein, unknown function [Plasmodium malariae]
MNFKNYCPFNYPESRNINALDDLLSSKESLINFKNFILKNLNVDSIDYDLKKIENKKNLLKNEEFRIKKWYLNFQPLTNISIEQYWKYEKVTIKDILSSNINISSDNNVELKKNKKYLKHICKCILKGNPHESLLKNCFKYSAYHSNNLDKHSRNNFTNNINSSLLSLNSRAIKNTQNLINWKLKYSHNFSNFQKARPDQLENSSSTFHSTDAGNNKKRSIDQRVDHNKGNNNGIASNTYKIAIKDKNSKRKKRKG